MRPTCGIDGAVTADGAVPIAGFSPGGVHSHEEHLFAAIRLAAQRGATEICYTPLVVRMRRGAAPLSRALNRCSHPGFGRVPRFMGVTGYGPRQSLGAHPANTL